MGRIRDFLNVFNNSSVLLLVRSRTQPEKATEVSEDEPLPVRVVGGGTGGGGGSDPASAREATLAQVRDAVQPLAAQAGYEGLHVRPPRVVGCHMSVMTVGTVTQNIPTNSLFDEATVHVISGAIRRGIGGEPSAQTPPLSVGDSEEIRGHELLVYRVVREGNTDAQLCIEYRTLGQPTPLPPVEAV